MPTVTDKLTAAFVLIAAVIGVLVLVACEGGFSDGPSEIAPSGADATAPAPDKEHEDAQPTHTTGPAPTSTMTPGSAATSVASADRDALVALYIATDGPNWVDNRYWLSDRPIVEWSGVVVIKGRVRMLKLHQNRLSGHLPPELGDLADLEYLFLWENELGGALPPQLGNLSNLKEVVLYGNRLSGELPPELGKLANLTLLSLGRNQLSGEIPPELGNMTELSRLDLWDNQLSGEIPPELGNLANLSTLSLAENRLTGGIPAELGNPRYLGRLDLEHNQLSGEIPPEIANAKELRLLWLSGNRLTGEIPPELANRSYLDLGEGDSARCIPEGLRNVRNDSPPPEPHIEVVDRTSDTATLRIDGQPEESPWQEPIQQPITLETRRSDTGEAGPYELVRSNIPASEYIDKSLDPDTTYYYIVKACNGCGCSEFSQATGAITEAEGPVDVPATPTGFAGRKIDVPALPDDAGLTWDAVEGATYYEVYQDADLDAEVSAPLTSYRDYSPNEFLGFDTTSYKVRACNKAGCSPFSEIVTLV